MSGYQKELKLVNVFFTLLSALIMIVVGKTHCRHKAKNLLLL